MPWIIGGATLASGALGAGSSKKAGNKAADASKQAAELQQQRYEQTRGDLAPYNATGQSVLPQFAALATGSPTGGGPDYVSQADALRPGAMTEAELVQTPGYQFTLGQGLKAVQSAAAARGLGVSGAALKGAATYATGLADNTYKDQFNIAQKQFENALTMNTAQQGNLTNQFSRLQNVATTGENAAAQTGTTGAQLANAAGNALTAAGQAQAAGITGSSNALTGAVNNYLGYNMLQNAINRNTAGPTQTQGAVGGNQPL